MSDQTKAASDSQSRTAQDSTYSQHNGDAAGAQGAFAVDARVMMVSRGFPYTLEGWAKHKRFDPPAKWLEAMRFPGNHSDPWAATVYAAEDMIYADFKPLFNPPLATIVELRRGVAAAGRAILGEFWEREAVEQFGGFVPAPEVVAQRVQPVRGGCRIGNGSWFRSNYWRMNLSLNATRQVVLHEAAHALTPRHGHDADFVRVSRRLYDRYLRTKP